MKAQSLVLVIAITLFGLLQAESPTSTVSGSKNSSSLTDPTLTSCDPLLLASYELEPIRFPTTEKNQICKNIKSNCCTMTSQQNIYNQWIGTGTRDKIITLYSEFINVWGSIFDRFKQVEEFAAKVIANSDKRKVSSCRDYAESIVQLGTSSHKTKILDIAKRAFRFLYDSRRGFACSLCDAEAHKSIDGTFGRIKLSHSFCGQIVKETMPLSLFRQKHFMKIARSLGQFILSCNADGIYKPNRSLSYDVKFFKEQQILDKVEKCQKNIKDNEAVAFCHDYCSHFNPVRFDEVFEGDLAKLNTFEKWIKRRLTKLTKPVKTEFSKADLNFTGRLLAEEKSVSASATVVTQGGSAANTPATNTTANSTPIKPGVATATTKSVGNSFTGINYTGEINRIRKEFGIQLKTGITYSASLDFSLKFNTNFSDSLFPLSPQPIYNLANFTIDFSKTGINYLLYGYMLAINDSTVSKLFVNKSGTDSKTSAISKTSSGSQNTVKKTQDTGAQPKTSQKTEPAKNLLKKRQ